MQINTAIKIDELNDDLYLRQNLLVHVARLDLLHPAISGNKYFKLKYNIEKAITQKTEGIITFGGAYSNHLAAAAFACKEAGLKFKAIIRGEEFPALSHTLIFCKEMGMEMEFVSRGEYSNREKLYRHFQNKYPSFYLVPEGGDNEEGEKGCTEILSNINSSELYTHILCDIGTGTTFKGIIRSSAPHQKVIGIIVLKGATEMNESLVKSLSPNKNFELLHDYHFGGYAKKTGELVTFMNHFYQQHNIPTDFVYTGKLFYALNDLISKKYFPSGSKILCIHTGGLQGNLSLPAGTLLF
ncbi:MAG: 1-aminocyclopropane-1-carboxylate deaminase/D-cysteine desulfhydrase [Sphingobacteriales bacterium]